MNLYSIFYLLNWITIGYMYKKNIYNILYGILIGVWTETILTKIFLTNYHANKISDIYVGVLYHLPITLILYTIIIVILKINEYTKNKSIQIQMEKEKEKKLLKEFILQKELN